jgi:hypothetical protein
MCLQDEAWTSSTRVERLVVIHLKTHTNHRIELNLACFLGRNVNCRRDHRLHLLRTHTHKLSLHTYCPLHRCILTTYVKDMVFGSFQPHCFKTKFTNKIFKQCKPVNAPTTYDTSQQSMPSPNIFIFQPIIILWKNEHLYSNGWN